MLFHCSGWFSLVAEALFQNVRFKQVTLSIFSHFYWLLMNFEFCGTSVILTSLQIKKKKEKKAKVTLSLPQCPALPRVGLGVIKCFISVPSKHLNSSLYY